MTGGGIARPALAVIWDMDGVLIDSGLAHFHAWQALAADYGRSITPDDFRLTFGMRNEEVIATLFGDLPLELALEMARRKEAHFRDEIRAGRVPTQPGARDLLGALAAAGVPQAVASSAPPENVEVVLDVLDLGRYFRAIVTGRDVRVGKPDPEIFVLAARALETPTDSCVVLEDAVVGVAAAKGAGARCVALVGSNTAEQLACADLVVESLGELSPARLESLFRRGA
jgi:beta-phosphoglucomutase